MIALREAATFSLNTVRTNHIVCLICPCYFNFFQYDHKRVTELSNRLVNGIAAGLTHVIRNGDPDHSYPGCVNLSFAFVEGESLLMALKDVALSSGRWDKTVCCYMNAQTQHYLIETGFSFLMKKQSSGCGHNYISSFS